MQEVEREEGGRPPGVAIEARLERGCVRPPVGIDHDQLPVEHRRARRDPDGRAGQLGECRGPVRAVGIDDPNVARSGRLGRPDEDQRAGPTPPRLEQVLVGIERLGERPREHRPQIGQVRQAIGGGIERERELVGHRGFDGSPRGQPGSRGARGPGPGRIDIPGRYGWYDPLRGRISARFGDVIVSG